MLLETRVLGKKRRPLDRWSVSLPPGDAPGGDGDGMTLRTLIERIVRAEVHAFEARERARRLVRVLGDADIAEGAARGKIDPGGRPPIGAVDEAAAVAAALQGFVDGVYLVVLDGDEQRDLERQVFVTENSHLVFLRLTFLAGA
jgi:hypothetical protein